MSKKEKAFELFNQGKAASSPELQALGLKNHTRHNYYWEWQKEKGIVSPSLKGVGEAKGKIKVISELEMIAEPTGEVNEEGPEVNEDDRAIVF